MCYLLLFHKLHKVLLQTTVLTKNKLHVEVDFFLQCSSSWGEERVFREETSGGWLDHWAWTLLIYLCISELCCRPLHLTTICVTPQVLFRQSCPPPKTYQPQCTILSTTSCSVIYSSVQVWSKINTSYTNIRLGLLRKGYLKWS